jgi:hypothetical protein
MPMMCLLLMLILCGTDMIMLYFSELMSMPRILFSIFLKNCSMPIMLFYSMTILLSTLCFFVSHVYCLAMLDGFGGPATHVDC